MKIPIIVCALALMLTAVQAFIGLVDITRVLFQFPHTPVANGTETAYAALGIGLSVAAVGFILGIFPREFRRRRRRNVQQGHSNSYMVDADDFLNALSFVDDDDGCLAQYASVLLKTRSPVTHLHPAQHNMTSPEIATSPSLSRCLTTFVKT